MLTTIEGKPVKDLKKAVIVSNDVAVEAEKRMKLGKCTCLSCMKKAVPKGVFSGETLGLEYP